jgi:hypothetical protein
MQDVENQNQATLVAVWSWIEVCCTPTLRVSTLISRAEEHMLELTVCSSDLQFHR